MVIEYAGELIRSTLTDQRERYYNGRGIGCYMFKIDDNLVVDATMRGNAARFINHSCEVIKFEIENSFFFCYTNKPINLFITAKLLFESGGYSWSQTYYNFCFKANCSRRRINIRLQVSF